MIRSFYSIKACLLLTTLAFSALQASARDDWPQWRGPDRNGISKESGLLISWPASGPEVLWRAPLGEGYSGISIAGGLAYTLYADHRSEYVVCFDAATGERRWQVEIDDKFTNNYGNGPRMTPTIDDDRLYAISAKARLFAMHATTGAILWSHDLTQRFPGIQPDLGYSNSPLIVDSLLLVTVGGYTGQAVVALNKISGETIWSSHSDHPGYSSPVLIHVDGVRQAVFFTGTMVASLSPLTGKVYWTHAWRTDSYENVATPVILPGNRLFFSSPHAFDKGSAVLQVRKTGSQWAVRVAWKSNVMKNHFSTCVVWGNYLFGTDRSILKCIDSRTGKEMWRQRGFGEGTLILASGHLIVMGTYGTLALVEATETAYKERTRAQVLSGKCFTMPSLADGRLFLRNQQEIVCLNLKDSNQ